MSNRTAFRIISLALIIALLSGAAIYSAEAQDPPRPPEPKRPPQQQDAREKKGAQRQGAQADDPGTPGEDRIKIDTDLVNLDVTVIDQNNNPVANLRKEDFSVYEDKVKQTIESVNREEVPVSFGMAIDTSGSMRSKLQSVSDAAVSLIKQMRRADEAFVASFKAEAELVQEFTDDRRELEDAVGELYTSGGTALLDAIIATADYAQEKGKRRRKALVVITDGLEKNSSSKEKEVMEAIKEDEVQVYLVGFIDEEEEKGLFGKSPAKKAKDLLSRLADDSGGRAYFPKDVGEIPAIAAQISKDLRTQYVVSYYPSNDKRDGAFHTIQVGVNQVGGRKLIARARRGYYARNAQGQLPTASQKKSHVN
ncbi:MAG TPA: VWA domain-containing protein [Blastocatellia bacterium]|jgi:Ca-activated chloride channel family protein|nr:VWA domain-containing protein [Blastocatellia bacterium]